jgi:hypothetical protein
VQQAGKEIMSKHETTCASKNMKNMKPRDISIATTVHGNSIIKGCIELPGAKSLDEDVTLGETGETGLWRREASQASQLSQSKQIG